MAVPALRRNPGLDATSSICTCRGKGWRAGGGRFYNLTVREKMGGRGTQWDGGRIFIREINNA